MELIHSSKFFSQRFSAALVAGVVLISASFASAHDLQCIGTGPEASLGLQIRLQNPTDDILRAQEMFLVRHEANGALTGLARFTSAEGYLSSGEGLIVGYVNPVAVNLLQPFMGTFRLRDLASVMVSVGPRMSGLAQVTLTLKSGQALTRIFRCQNN